jgi:hypothetical protein
MGQRLRNWSALGERELIHEDRLGGRRLTKAFKLMASRVNDGVVVVFDDATDLLQSIQPLEQRRCTIR